jgi:hypothetical protein
MKRNTVMRNRHGWGLTLALGVLLWATGAGAAETPYQEGLGQLECVKLLIENPDEDGRSLGLSKDQLRNVLLVATRAKLPRLPASDESCRNALYLSVNMGTLNGKSGYYGAITVSVLRSARIVGTGEFVTPHVWKTAMILKGTRDSAYDHVPTIDDMTTEFAAAYYRAGNE